MEEREGDEGLEEGSSLDGCLYQWTSHSRESLVSGSTASHNKVSSFINKVGMREGEEKGGTRGGDLQKLDRYS